MTLRQNILKLIYPLFTWYKKSFQKQVQVLENEKKVQPAQSFYSLSSRMNNGSELKFDTFKGKKVLMVNTASDCGYTAQYDGLEKLFEEYGDKLVVIAFPANDFKEQEKGTDEEIASFCKTNYGVSFPLAAKSTVKKNSSQHPVFQLLTDRAKNGWNDKAPSWNFSKYLVNENGLLMNYFDPAVSPLSDEVKKAIGQ